MGPFPVATVTSVGTDPVLGEPFLVYPIHSKFPATLIQYPSSRSDSAECKGVVLYVHGYNDYFLQKDMALKADSAGYDFFAIDLHRYGRSLCEGDKPFNALSIEEYYEELDSAIAMATKGHETLPLIVLGHSTGGLISSLYADSHRGRISALVLNSPFLEMNMNWPMRNIVVPVASAIGKFLPDFPVNDVANPNYSNSLHKSANGEWDYDLRLKVAVSPEKSLGWIRAIHEGQVKAQAGLNIEVPVLVMHSDCSVRGTEWVDEYTHCDGVLDVDQIDEYGRKLGKDVTVHMVPGGLHDLFLSKKAARDEAYDTAFRFMDSAVKVAK